MTGLEQVLAVLVMLGPVLCCAPLARARRPGRVAATLAVATAFVAVVWQLHKAPYEGPAILSLTATRGLTVVDLVVPAALGTAGAVLWRRRCEAPGRTRSGPG